MKHYWVVDNVGIGLSEFEATEFLQNKKVRIAYDVASWDLISCIQCGKLLTEETLNGECLGDYG